MYPRREDQRDGRTGAGEKCARQAEVNGLPELLKQSSTRFSGSCRDVHVHCNGAVTLPRGLLQTGEWSMAAHDSQLNGKDQFADDFKLRNRGAQTRRCLPDSAIPFVFQNPLLQALPRRAACHLPLQHNRLKDRISAQGKNNGSQLADQKRLLIRSGSYLPFLDSPWLLPVVLPELFRSFLARASVRQLPRLRVRLSLRQESKFVGATLG